MGHQSCVPSWKGGSPPGSSVEGRGLGICTQDSRSKNGDLFLRDITGSNGLALSLPPRSFSVIPGIPGGVRPRSCWGALRSLSSRHTLQSQPRVGSGAPHSPALLGLAPLPPPVTMSDCLKRDGLGWAWWWWQQLDADHLPCTCGSKSLLDRSFL